MRGLEIRLKRQALHAWTSISAIFGFTFCIRVLLQINIELTGAGKQICLTRSVVHELLHAKLNYISCLILLILF